MSFQVLKKIKDVSGRLGLLASILAVHFKGSQVKYVFLL